MVYGVEETVMNIRLALAADYPAICAYLESHWRKGHIFTKSKVLFDWQHWDAARARYNFILGCATDGDIQGVLGFIPHGQFDPALGFDSIWLCIWHASVKGTGLGRRMLDWLEETFRPTFLGTNGASEMSLPLYQARGWETGKLEHWYLELSNARKPAPSGTYDAMRGKGKNYRNFRYGQHPVYAYNDNLMNVTRLCVADGVRLLRIVDCESPGTLKMFNWEHEMRKAGSSMVDFYCAGFNHGHMEEAGFTRRIADEVIIPNYFEPYEHRNVDINYAVKVLKGMPWRIVKGDGDQDRPNVLP